MMLLVMQLQVSLGYSAFLGIGAYTTVLLALRGVDPFLSLPLGAVIAAAFSVVIGLPAFRLRGPYFTIATIGVAEAIRVCASSVQFTGGSSGLRMPAASFDFNKNYFAMVVLAIATVAAAAYVKRSAFGRALAAIKQDIDAAEAVGVHSTRFKLAAHAISAALVALAGFVGQLLELVALGRGEGADLAHQLGQLGLEFVLVHFQPDLRGFRTA